MEPLLAETVKSAPVQRSEQVSLTQNPQNFSYEASHLRVMALSRLITSISTS